MILNSSSDCAKCSFLSSLITNSNYLEIMPIVGTKVFQFEHLLLNKMKVSSLLVFVFGQWDYTTKHISPYPSPFYAAVLHGTFGQILPASAFTQSPIVFVVFPVIFYRPGSLQQVFTFKATIYSSSHISPHISSIFLIIFCDVQALEQFSELMITSFPSFSRVGVNARATDFSQVYLFKYTKSRFICFPKCQ